MSNKMNIWLIQRSEITPIDYGENRLMRTGLIADIMQRQGHKVKFWTSDFNHFQHKHRFKGSKLVRVNNNYYIQFIKSIGYEKNFSLRRYLDDIFVAREFINIAHNSELPDVILVSMPSIELASKVTNFAKQRNIPVYVEIRDLWPDIFIDVAPIFLRPFLFVVNLYLNYKLKKCLLEANGVIGITESYLRWALRKINKKRTINDEVFHMSYLKPSKQANLSKKYIKDCIERKFSFLLEEKIVFVFIGTLGKTNDIETVLNAAKKISTKNFPNTFVIAGKGEKYSMLRKKYVNQKNIKFVGWLDKDEIKVLLSKSDVGILPYIDADNYKLNIPNKPSEYLSEGLYLALSLNEGEMYNLIKKNNIGFSYSNNEKILIKKLKDLIKNKHKIKENKKLSFKLFNNYFDANKTYSDLAFFLTERINKNG